jgi:hypothetical protein
MLFKQKLFYRNKEYFPFNKYVFELPNLKLNIHKQMAFIITDYLDNYIYPLFPDNISEILAKMKRPNINKQEIKKTKLRQMVYRRLMEDFYIRSKYKRTGKNTPLRSFNNIFFFIVSFFLSIFENSLSYSSLAEIELTIKVV